MIPKLAFRVGTASRMLALLALASLLPIVASSSEERASLPLVSDRVVGAGRWQSQRDSLGNRDWQVQIMRFDDDSIEGSLVVIGSPMLHKVRLEGRVDGGEVYGALLGDANEQLGTFAGTVFDGGVSGTYTTIDGDAGNWTWAGPAGARSLREKPESADRRP